MTPALKNRPGNFTLPAYSQTRNAAEKNGRLSHAFVSMASDARIQEATPSLRKLYAFLGTKPGERARP